ncbi:hypothetical protein NL676_019816 [Syzygium grande]|nr:hypothetical protein NL676_019816 [Syzygium grande]
MITGLSCGTLQRVSEAKNQKGEKTTTTLDGGNLDLIAAAKRFLENYYRTFDANPADLVNLYREELVMISDGRKLQGKEAILAQLTSLQHCQHQILTIGC